MRRILDEWLHNRRVARWRKLCIKRDELTDFLARIEENAIEDPQPTDEFVQKAVKRARSSVVDEIERLEAKERQRVPA